MFSHEEKKKKKPLDKNFNNLQESFRINSWTFLGIFLLKRKAEMQYHLRRQHKNKGPQDGTNKRKEDTKLKKWWI